MKFVTSFGFRVGLIVASHLFALIALIASGEWLALVWLIVASGWAAVAFMQEQRADRWQSIANGWRELFEEERRVP